MFYLLLFLAVGDYNPTTLVVPPVGHSGGFYRASKYYLNLFLGPRFSYRDPQGVAAVKLNELDNPRTKRDDDELTLFAVNSGSGEIVYNVGFEAIRVFKRDFINPKGIAVLPSGLVYLADYGNNRVVKMEYKKGDLRIVNMITDDLINPVGVALDSKGNLYVSDHGHSLIKVFGPDDQLKMTIGQERAGAGELFKPTAIAVIDDGDSFNFYRDNFMAVIDQQGRRLQAFTLSGKFLKSITSPELGLAEASFTYLAIDRFGNIYVTDSVNNQVHKFDHNLRYIISYGRTGVNEGEFVSPRGISIWRRFGQVIISEREGGQYLWTNIDVFLIGCFPEEFVPGEKATTIALYLTELGEVKIYINKLNGEKVCDLITVHQQPPGDFLVLWDGRDNRGQIVPPGLYEVHIVVRSQYLRGFSQYLTRHLTTRVRCIEGS